MSTIPDRAVIPANVLVNANGSDHVDIAGLIMEIRQLETRKSARRLLCQVSKNPKYQATFARHGSIRKSQEHNSHPISVLTPGDDGAQDYVDALFEALGCQGIRCEKLNSLLKAFLSVRVYYSD